MRKLAIALAALASLGIAAPAFANDAAPSGRIHVAQADVKVRVGTPSHRRTVKRVIVRHDRGYHAGWRHNHRHGSKVVVIKKRPHVTKRVIIHR
jgi:hypothetical protein